jgi:hypothetical protein
VGEPPGGGEEDATSMAISGEPGHEEGEPPGGSEEEVASVDISGDQRPEVVSPPATAKKTSPTWLSAASQARRKLARPLAAARKTSSPHGYQWRAKPGGGRAPRQ